MGFVVLREILKYLDLFGTNFNFYTEKNRKFYTSLGGILTLLSIIIGALVFIFINLDDFLHNNPNSTTSTSRENERNITFLEEKIWIPWRIRDYEGKTVNYTGLFFPIAYYYQGIRNDTRQRLNLTYRIIESKLCNETPMAQYADSFIINMDLDQLYCIDMDEFDMGGTWDSLFINYVEFDLYICEDGIDYDENNTKCNTYDKIVEAAQQNNSFEIEIYYPVVHYQPMNKTLPIYVRYTNYFYHLSRFSNKIDRIYLQEYILKDDQGWIIKQENIYKHWGYLSLSGDSYATGDQRDLMNEGSSSRLYSFNIYLKSDIVYYNRSYKKIFLILADGLPIVNIIFVIFKLIAKVFKISSGNKKLTELLFENLQENKLKKIRTEKYDKYNLLKINKKKFSSDRKIKKIDNNNSYNKINVTNNIISTNNIINDASSVQISSQYEKGKFYFNINKKKFSFNKKKKRLSLNNNNNNNNNSNNKIVLNRTLKSNYNINYGNVGVNNNNINININNSNTGNYYNKNNENSSILQSSKANINKKFNSEEHINNNNSNSNNNNSNFIFKTKEKSIYIKKKLFPYKYYLCSIFIKNINMTRRTSMFFTKKFIVVYNFICQLFDISSYLILQREFQILKSTLMIGKYKSVLENRQKINVNDLSFNTDMKECLDSQKFSILGRIKNYNN